MPLTSTDLVQMLKPSYRMVDALNVGVSGHPCDDFGMYEP